MLASFEKYDQTVIYMNTADYTQFAVYGTDKVTGLPYAADDPVLLLWIHTTLVD